MKSSMHMLAQQNTRLIALVVVTIGICCCEAPAPDVPVVKSGAAAPPLRLTHEGPPLDETATANALVVPMDGEWQVVRAERGAAEGAALRLSASTEPAVLRRILKVDASTCTALRIEMNVSAGEYCTFSWQSDIEPNATENPGVSVPLLPKQGFRTYTLPLDASAEVPWIGQVDLIQFVPSDSPADVEIRSFEFVSEPPARPRQATIRNQTHEALFSVDCQWAVTVPSEAVFETHVGLLERSWRALSTDGARFLVTIQPDGAPSEVLVDRTLRPTSTESDRSWSYCTADLRAFAGRHAAIALRVESLGTTTGDFACWGDPMIFSRDFRGANTPVILISCDTLRADHVSCYGYERKTTPNLDAFAQEGVVFETAITQEGWTLPSHVTMLTGLYPKDHGVTANVNLSDSAHTLAESLRDEAGYLTAAFAGQSWWFFPWRGLARGFDHYSIPEGFRDVFETHDLAYSWLANHADVPFFLFLHNYDIHGKPPGTGRYNDDAMPYFPAHPRYLRFSNALPVPPRFRDGAKQEYPGALLLRAANWEGASITPEEREYIVALYDDSILCVDAAIGECFDRLKSLGVYDRALIIVTADHGEEFGEHTKYLHGQAYESIVHVPLIVRFPGGRYGGHRYDGLAQLTDLAPTVMSTLGLAIPGDIDGRNLAALLDGSEEGPHYAYTRNVTTNAVRTRHLKLLHDTSTGSLEFYNLYEDPVERVNRYDGGNEECQVLQRELEQFHQEPPGGWHLVFEGASEPIEIEVVGNTNDRFDRCGFDLRELREFREQNVAVDRGGRRMTARVLLGADDRDELRLRTAAPKKTILVEFAAPTKCVVLARGEAWMRASKGSLLLDPGDSRFHQPPDEPSSRVCPVIRLWYEEPPTTRSAARELTEQDYEDLKALGYLGDEGGGRAAPDGAPDR